MMLRRAALLVAVLCACNNAPRREALQKQGQLPPLDSHITPPATPPPPAPVVEEGPPITSKAILERTPSGDPVLIKHVLLAWKDLEPIYRGHLDPRAKERSQTDAANLAQEVSDKAVAGAKFDDLVKEFSEDKGQPAGEPYEIRPDKPFVEGFKTMALRMKVGETAIARSEYGYHVMQRVPPPPPDPLESRDILARQPVSDHVWVKHVLLGWRELTMPGHRPPDPRAMARSKADTDVLVQKVVADLKAGKPIDPMMTELSEDPGSAKTLKAYEIKTDTPFVEPFKNLSLRLNPGEVGVVKTQFGFHVIQRVESPKPDAIESAEILARDPVTQKDKVKHILIGWKDLAGAYGGHMDPRADKRDRAEAEKIVKDILAKLKGGAKFEDLMKELSEDPGSAAKGTDYAVSPEAGLVPPFKELSLRLKPNEVGVVKSDFGFHIIKRTE